MAAMKMKSMMKKAAMKKSAMKNSAKKGLSWLDALAKARKELKIQGFCAINKGVQGKALYNKAKAYQGK